MTLDASRLPEHVPELGKAAPELAVSGAASLPFSAEGQQAAIWCAGLNRPVEIRIGGRLVARVLPEAHRHPVNTVASPGMIRRESVGPAGTILENWLVAPTLPLVAAQWAAGGGTQLRVEVLPDAAGPIRGEGGALYVAEDPTQPGKVAAIALLAEGASWGIGTADQGAALEAVLDRPTTVLFAHGEPARVGAALSAAAHLPAHERRATRAPDDRLSVHSGIGAVDEAVGWAASRLARALDGAQRAGPHDASWAASLFTTGIGALVLGDVPAAERAATLLGTAADVEMPSPWPTPPLAALLDARISMATGAATLALPWVERALGETIFGEDEASRAVGALALDTLADAIRYAAPRETIAALRDRATGMRAGTDDSAHVGARRLPMVGGDEAPAHFLGFAFEGGPMRAPHTGVDRLDAALGLWGAWAEAPDSSWVEWRTTLLEGLVQGPAGPGTWDVRPPDDPRGAPVAGALMAALVHGALGYRVDAPTGRLHLGPRLPAHLKALEVRGLMSGPDTVALQYRRTGDHHEFEVRPERARVPIGVVLEPSLPGIALAGARINGEAVELDAVQHRDRIRPRVQLILDATHTVEWDVTPA